ncbi:MAG: 1-phosphofructokinase [Anaerolineales bacterium]
MIYTLTLNPALDLELTVDEIRFDELLRASHVRTDCGGKGFNIARGLTRWGVPCLALGLLGGKTGERLQEELHALGVHTDFLWITGETRTNIAVVTSKPGKYIKVNQPGPPVEPLEMDHLLEKVRKLAVKGDLWVLSGSLPPGSDLDSYASIIQIVQAAGGRALLDADGDTLVGACRAEPFLIKPNALEASQVTGVEVNSPRDVPRAAQRLQEMGAKWVLVTLGEQGAVLCDGKRAWWAKPPVVAVQSPIGAGDATLAGFVWGVSQGKDKTEALRIAVASGTASASLPGTAVASGELVDQIATQVDVGAL